mgnify:CR=1 FL=1
MDKFGFVELKDVCNINMGQSPDSDSYNDNEDGIPFFQGNADFGEKYPTTRKWCNAPTKIAHAEDILISVRAPIGALNYAKEECCIGRGLAAITPNQDKVSSEFIYWLLKGKHKELNLQGTGSTFKAISRKVLEKIKVPDIELKKQTELAGNLEKVYSVIQLRKQQLEELDTLIKARFVEMFGDPRFNEYNFEKKMLRDTCKVVTGNTPSRAVDEYYGDYIEWIKTDNIVSGQLTPTTASESLSEEGMQVGRTVDEDAILMACIAGSVASIGRVCVTDRKVAFNQQINAIVPQEYNTLFLYTLLQISKDYLVEEINMALKGILSKSRLEEKTFIVPPMEVQDEFADFVTQVDKLKVAVQESLDELQTLFDSLMQQYFG